MSKLDTNYLGFVRKSLYNTETTSKNVPLKKVKVLKKLNQQASTQANNSNSENICKPFKAKDVKFVHFNQDLCEKDVKEQNIEFIKDRISTPFKHSTSEHSKSTEDNVSIITEKVSPSLNNGGTNSFPKEKGKKRSLSVSDTVEEVIVKRKKEKPTKTGMKLNFDDTVDDNTPDNTSTSLNNKPQIKINALKNKKKNKTNEIFEDKSTVLFTLTSQASTTNFSENILSSIKSTSPERNTKLRSKKKTLGAKTINKDEPGTKKHFKNKKYILNTVLDITREPNFCISENTHPTQNPLLVAEDAADFYDDEKVIVKGLKFTRFCDLFAPIHHIEQLPDSGDIFKIPKKHLISSQDELDTNRKEVQDKANSNKHIKENILNVPVFKSTLENGNVDSLIQNSPIVETVEEHSTLTPNMNTAQLLDDSTQLKEPQINYTENTDIDNDEVPKPAKIVNLKNKTKVIILQYINQTIHFNGLSSLEVLNGEVEILGASLNKSSGERRVYSPRGTSLLYIKNTYKLLIDGRINLKELVSEDLLNKSQINLSFEPHCAILLCKELKEPYIDFIEGHISQKIFPESSNLEPRVDFELSGAWNKTKTSEEWEEVLECVSEESKTVVCGGKGVGKSTFLRYAVNTLLTKFKKIRVVDLDPGQSELFPPGCISVATVERDILGPNYTHFQSADRLILSHINIGYNVQQYLKSVKHLLEPVEVMEKLPTLVNFPGFTQGLGLDIAANILKLLLPTLVVEIKSKQYSKNYIIDLTSENMNNFNFLNDIFDLNESYDDILHYEFVTLESLSERNEAWSMEARPAREISILSYFGKMMSESIRDLISPAINMLSINISAVNIVNLEGQSLSPMTINGNLVALCALNNKESDVFTSYGYGFVRGLDLETDVLVLMTPEPIETLDNVSHLVLSSISTPPSLIMSASGIKGHVPFVNIGDLVDFGQFTKRSYLPPKK